MELSSKCEKWPARLDSRESMQPSSVQSKSARKPERRDWEERLGALQVELVNLEQRISKEENQVGTPCLTLQTRREEILSRVSALHWLINRFEA